jgi:hypothetical protein
VLLIAYKYASKKLREVGKVKLNSNTFNINDSVCRTCSGLQAPPVFSTRLLKGGGYISWYLEEINIAATPTSCNSHFMTYYLIRNRSIMLIAINKVSGIIL